MDATSQQLTRYYRAIQTQANLQDCRFTSRTPFATVSSADITAGRLDEAVTNELFTLAKARRDRPLDVIISLATLQDGAQAEGLALIAAQLDADGRLTADLGSQAPWIPASRLRSSGVTDRQLMVGTLAGFWRWRLTAGEERASQAEDFADVIAYTEAMVDAVFDTDLIAAGLKGGQQTELHRPGALPHTCWLTPGTVIEANGAILDLYRHLIEDDPSPALYEQFVALDGQDRSSEDGIDEDRDLLLETATRATGSMSDGFPLTASQRRAVHAFLLDGHGDVTAVSGPPGTGKTTMLQSVVASLIVTHCLQDRPAPLIMGTSTNNQAVTNIIDSFSSVAKDDAGPLARRWLPAATEDGAADTPLRGLAAYAPSGAKAKEAQAKGYLLENNRKAGVYTQYSAPEYVKAATARFLADLGGYTTAARFGAPTDLAKAEAFLAKALKRVDQRRRELLTARHAADATVPAPTGPGADVAALRAEMAVHEDRLRFWTSVAAAGPTDAMDAEFNFDDSEPAPAFDSVDEFRAFYQNRLVELAGTLERAERDQAARAGIAHQATLTYGQAVTEPLKDLTRLCLLTEEQVDRLRTAEDILALDQTLDVTVRHAAFWLAVHRYEAQWLTVCAGEDLIPQPERNRTTLRYMDRYWPQAAALTPCFVMTAYQLPKYFKLWAKAGEKSAYDLERADLLIVDEAGQVDASLGAAAFALAKRALVVGDVQQLAPVWGIDPESDRVMGESFGFGPEWDTLERRGLTASDHSSVMMAAAGASRWSYGKDDDEGLFLAEHFRCRSEIIEYCNELLYKGQLVPSRPSAGYRLEGLVEHPFLFREVPGSEDHQQGSSRVNQAEAEAIAAWLDEHWDRFCEAYGAAGDPEKEKGVFGVVTPFAAQARVIRQTLGRVLGPDRAKLVTVGTAHTLQGAERSIVLFSSVYGDNSGQASFIDNTLELMNVAVSRAKDLFIVFGAKTRWNDGGPVFRLVRRMAVKDAPAGQPAVAHDDGQVAAPVEVAAAEPISAAEPAAEPSVPDVSAPKSGDAVVARAMIAAWDESGGLPDGLKLSAVKLNKALAAAGLIRKGDRGWEPTDEGAAVGIVGYEGERDGETFVNVKYTPAAQVALLDRIRSGALSLG